MKMMKRLNLFFGKLVGNGFDIVAFQSSNLGKILLFQSKNAFQSFLMIQVREEILLFGVNCDSQSS